MRKKQARQPGGNRLDFPKIKSIKFKCTKEKDKAC